MESDSESECFESAEESPDEREQNIEVVKSKAPICLPNDEKPTVKEEMLVPRDDSPMEQLPPSRDAVAYRKRPEKPKQPSKKTSAGSLNTIKKGLRTDSIFKTDAITPDHLFQDITTSLSKNINKSLSTIQQTSSNVKDLIMGSLPLSEVNQKEVFTYDDVTITSPPSEGDSICKALSQSSLSEVNHTLPSTEYIKNCDENSERSYKSVNLFDSSILADQTCSIPLKSKLQAEPAKTKLFSSSLPKTFNVPEISDFLKLTDNTNVLDKYSESPTTENTTTKTKRIFEPKQDINILNKLHSGVDYNKRKHHSSKPFEQCLNEMSSNVKVASNVLKNEKKSVSPELKKSIQEFSSQNTSPSPLMTEAKYRSPGTKDVNEDSDLIEEASKICAEYEVQQEQLLKKPSKSKTNEPNNTKTKSQCAKKKFNSLQTCSKMAKIEKKDTKYKFENNPKVLTKENINWEDPIRSWTGTNSSDERDKQDEFTAEKKELQERPSLKHGSSTPHVSDKIIQKVKMNRNVKCESNTKVDGWDDFDFSDSEIVTTRSFEGSTLTFNADEEKMCIDHTKDQNHRPTEQKPCLHKEESKNVAHKIKPTTMKIEGKSKSQNTKEVDSSNESDCWNWDSWGDNENINPETDVRPTGEGKEMEDIWSGWNSFGQKQSEDQSSNWGSWSVNMLLDKATAVTQGISNVLEAGLGAPDPQTLAMMDQKKCYPTSEKAEKNTKTEVSSASDSSLFSFGLDLVTGVKNKIVEHSAINPAKFQKLGTKVITGGLDTLESFGKKTMEVLQEGDPGLKSTRAMFLPPQQPLLSDVLKEIKEKTEKSMKEEAERQLKRKCHFEDLFDDYQGILVALQCMVSIATSC